MLFHKSSAALFLLVLFLMLSACGTPFGASEGTKGPALRLTGGIGRATLAWNTVLGAEGYRLEWSTDAAFSPALTTVVDPARSPFDHEDQNPGVSYHYRVRATLNSGPTAWSTTTLTTSNWAWARSQSYSGPTESQVTKAYDFGTVTTTLVQTVTLMEKMSLTDSGVSWSTWYRTATALKGLDATTTADSPASVVTGSWSQRWTSFTLTPGGSHSVAFGADRKTFTLDGKAPVWTLLE